MADIPVISFLTLRQHFFHEDRTPRSFRLRDKRNTQDDPFDEYLATQVLASSVDIACIRASGPLITPDMVLYRRSLCVEASASDLSDDIHWIVGIEVKKLQRTRSGRVARESGLDYNTTPPCGRIRVYDSSGKPVDIRGFYLFVCIERYPKDGRDVVLTALCMIDGNAINEDFDLYLTITGQREKRIGLGTYGDGADRARPMLIFANPLGVPQFDHAPILIHPDDSLAQSVPELCLVYRLHRSTPSGQTRTFYCYRHHFDITYQSAVEDLQDPFPTPTRDTRTQARGRFRLPFSL